MEILCKNNIRICFYFRFTSIESIINHSHDRVSMVILTCVSFMIPTLARHERLHHYDESKISLLDRNISTKVFTVVEDGNKLIFPADWDVGDLSELSTTSKRGLQTKPKVEKQEFRILALEELLLFANFHFLRKSLCIKKYSYICSVTSDGYADCHDSQIRGSVLLSLLFFMEKYWNQKNVILQCGA